MPRLSALVSLLLVLSTSAFAGVVRSDDEPFHPAMRIGDVSYRHFILTPARRLNEQEQADLAKRGLVVEKPLTNGRYLVRMAENATVDASDPRVASLTALTADRKLHRSLLREVATGRPYATVNVLFHDEVSFESAKQAIEAAGGTFTEPLQNDFHVPNRIPARIAASAVPTLAADERVLLVYGPLNFRIETENAVSAALSNVTPLLTAPYDLSGQGVVLSYFELAEADASHPEFEGRLTTHPPFIGSAPADKRHATHVAGTMISAGKTDPRLKGMAPKATLHEYDANNDNFLDFKKNLPSISSSSDNNSWGYVLGWCNTGSCSDHGWIWEDNAIYYGAYDTFVTAPIDKITRTNGTLFVHSAGNDADKTGPGVAPYAHAHYDDNGTAVDGYCYSENGSGTDCPAPICKSGAFCEVTRHPQISSLLPPPWMSIGVTASAKNVIAVGAVDTSKQITGFSSRGPTRDGRVKPDLVARGQSVYSTIPGGGGASISGTSMAAPAVTGASALLIEQWRRTFGGASPSAAVLKTLMIGTAQDLGPAGPDYTYGFGLLDAKAAVDTIIADAAQGRRIRTDSMATGGKVEIPILLTSQQTLRVTVGWADPEVVTFPIPVPNDPTDNLAAATLVNDLDLKVVDASGRDVLPYVLDPQHPDAAATQGANHVDNTEEVEIPNAAPGSYKVVVTGTSVTVSSPQTFTVVANAELGAAVAPCTDVNEPNNSEAAAYGNVVSSQTLSGRTCEAGDVDYFKFLVDKPGTVSVSVTATDTPVRVTLSSGATTPATADIPAGETRTVSVTYSGSTPVLFFVRVEPTATPGALARYSITPVFPSAQHGKRRSVRGR